MLFAVWLRQVRSLYMTRIPYYAQQLIWLLRSCQMTKK